MSTSEIDTPPNALEALDLDMLASELMWDAVLAAIPEQPTAMTPASGAPAAADLRRYAGDYLFGPGVCLHVEAVGARITAVAAGARPVYAIGRNAPTELQPLSPADFAVPGRYPLTLHFDGSGIIVNPGHWAQRGVRQSSCERATGAG